jgi:16S rRNA (guanine1207-N2)-methyltransferase
MSRNREHGSDSDEPRNFQAMDKRKRPDDDYSNIPTVKSGIPQLDGRARFFIGKGDLVIVKLDSDRPEVVVAAEEVEIPQNSRVLVMNSNEGFIGVTLAATNPSSRFFLYESNLAKSSLSQRNVEANAEIAPNAQVVSEDQLSNLIAQGVNVIVFRPPGFVAQELIEDLIAFASRSLPIGGELIVITHKKSGGERHAEMMKRNVVGKVEVVSKSKGGFRVIHVQKTAESSQEVPSLKAEIEIDVLGQKLSLVTEPGLFSREHLDSGTQLLLESVDLESFQRLLDIGCGWGAIGLTAATINPQGEVYMADVDTRAVRVANENAQRLGINDRAQAVATEDLRTLPGNFDLMLSNPPFHADTKVLTQLFEAARDKFAKKGNLCIVVEQTYLKKLQDILQAVFGNVAVLRQDPVTKFTILHCRK